MNIHNILYTLKKSYAVDFNYVQILSEENDDETGRRIIKKKLTVLKGCLLPQTQLRKFIQDIGYLAANKNFTYGALNDFNNITFLLDADDFPIDFNLELNGYINRDHKRFERVSFTNLFDSAYLLVCKGVEGANPYAISQVIAGNVLQFQGNAVCELN